ncbi:DoxX family protein [Mycolicibacterium sp. jd]|uniref:DoxX family protein n=1 Tax=unclassified Mycolicibacterium TaxID=2636767 RepID=UPI00351AD23C
MFIATAVLSILLAALLGYTGAMKVIHTATAADNAAHLGINARQSQLIGAAELAAVAGLLVGLAVRPLLIVTAAAVVALMIGAIAYHLRAKDPLRATLPAAVTAAAAIAALALTLAAP